MDHWKQLVTGKRFNKYDYGTKVNIQQYGQPYPPDFNLTNINVPMYLFFGLHDSLVDAKDAQILLDTLAPLPNVHYKYYPASHITYLMSTDISFYWNDLIEILNKDE